MTILERADREWCKCGNEACDQFSVKGKMQCPTCLEIFDVSFNHDWHHEVWRGGEAPCCWETEGDSDDILIALPYGQEITSENQWLEDIYQAIKNETYVFPQRPERPE
jgi:hypothetical protein